VLLDGAQAQGAVTAGARQNDTGSVLALGSGQGEEKGVDRRTLPARLDQRPEAQVILRHGERAVAGNDVDMVALDRHGVAGLDDRDLGAAAEHGGERALVRRIEMLDDDIGDAAVRLEQRQQRFERTDAAGRGADADDRNLAITTRFWISFAPALIVLLLHATASS